jgi:hypothetical protein
MLTDMKAPNKARMLNVGSDAAPLATRRRILIGRDEDSAVGVRGILKDILTLTIG